MTHSMRQLIQCANSFKARHDTAYCIWSVISSFSNLNRSSSSRRLFYHVLLKKDQGFWDWRLRLYDTPNATGCIYTNSSLNQRNLKLRVGEWESPVPLIEWSICMNIKYDIYTYASFKKVIECLQVRESLLLTNVYVQISYMIMIYILHSKWVTVIECWRVRESLLLKEVHV